MPVTRHPHQSLNSHPEINPLAAHISSCKNLTVAHMPERQESMTRLLFFPVVIIAGLYVSGQTAIASGIAALLVVAWIFRRAIRSFRRAR